MVFVVLISKSYGDGTNENSRQRSSAHLDKIGECHNFVIAYSEWLQSRWPNDPYAVTLVRATFGCDNLFFDHV